MGIHRRHTIDFTRSAASSSGDQVITGLGGKPAIGLIVASDDLNGNINCVGWDDGALAITQYNIEVSFLTTLLGALGVGSLSRNSLTESIRIINGANGWSAKFTALGVDGVTITWTKLGSGRAITGKIIFIL